MAKKTKEEKEQEERFESAMYVLKVILGIALFLYLLGPAHKVVVLFCGPLCEY